MDLLRNSEQLAAQRHHRSTDTLGDYDDTQVRDVIKRVQEFPFYKIRKCNYIVVVVYPASCKCRNLQRRGNLVV